MKKKRFKCPFCNKIYITKNTFYSHLDFIHRDNLEGMSPAQYLFYMKYGKKQGNCIICKKSTKWNEKMERYERLCSRECSDKYREIFKQRMKKKYGKTTLLDEPEQQKKMLANRKISGVYIFTDGTKVQYTGSYEKDFLNYIEHNMGIQGKNIMAPAPQVFYYDFENKKRFYIPDFYLPELNLIVEIKDGGNNPNTHPNRINKDLPKEKIKDDLMIKQNDYNFIKIKNKEYTDFSNIVAIIKEENALAILENRKPKVFKML